MGVLASGSVHARPSAHPPIDTSGNISAHVSGRGLNKISDDSKHFLCFQMCRFLVLFNPPSQTLAPKNFS